MHVQSIFVSKSLNFTSPHLHSSFHPSILNKHSSQTDGVQDLCYRTARARVNNSVECRFAGPRKSTTQDQTPIQTSHLEANRASICPALYYATLRLRYYPGCILMYIRYGDIKQTTGSSYSTSSTLQTFPSWYALEKARSCS